MRCCIVFALFLASLVFVRPGLGAEISNVIDAADGNDPFDLNIDIQFRSVRNQSKITHETDWLWTQDPTNYAHQPEQDELRYEQQTYVMDAMLEIGLYHDLELYSILPWIIDDKRTIRHAAGRDNLNSTLFRTTNADPAYPGNALAEDPTGGITSKRSGIGDVQLGVKWAAFNQERDTTKSVWVVGLELTLPTGRVVNPMDVADGDQGGVGLGHYVVRPFMLFSYRYRYIDPYVGIHGCIPIQGDRAETLGLVVPYHGGFLTGLEIVPWEDEVKDQKLSIDFRFTSEFFTRAANRGTSGKLGGYNEVSDFLAGGADADPTIRQLQDTQGYAQLGVHLSFIYRTGSAVRIRIGTSLAHNTQHLITGTSACIRSEAGQCSGADANPTFVNIYDSPGRRLKVEESTIFSWWVSAVMTF